MFNPDAYSTSRWEVRLRRLLLLSGAPLLIATSLGGMVWHWGRLEALLFGMAALALIGVSVFSLRLWAFVPREATKRAAELGADLMCPIVKFTVSDASGVLRHGGKGWCLIRDGEVFLEEFRGASGSSGESESGYALTRTTQVCAASPAPRWAVPRVHLDDAKTRVSFEVMPATGTPYSWPSPTAMAEIVARIDAAKAQRNQL